MSLWGSTTKTSDNKIFHHKTYGEIKSEDMRYILKMYVTNIATLFSNQTEISRVWVKMVCTRTAQASLTIVLVSPLLFSPQTRGWPQDDEIRGEDSVHLGGEGSLLRDACYWSQEYPGQRRVASRDACGAKRWAQHLYSLILQTLNLATSILLFIIYLRKISHYDKNFDLLLYRYISIMLITKKESDSMIGSFSFGFFSTICSMRAQLHLPIET